MRSQVPVPIAVVVILIVALIVGLILWRWAQPRAVGTGEEIPTVKQPLKPPP